MFSHESLDIWKLSIEYAKKIYLITEDFPKSEIYGLTNQIRRAVVSISSNIAEGSGGTLNDNLRFLDIAVKSALETTSQAEIAFQLKYISTDQKNELHEMAEKIIRKTRAYKKFLKNDKP